MDLALHVERARAASGAGRRGRSYDYEPGSDGIAVIDVVGSLMKQESSASSSTSTAMLRGTIRKASADPEVKGIMLRVDSPGGTVAGTQDLADDIAAAAARKPMAAYVEDLCASAAYWLASQCPTISANKGLVGSIGTYMTVYDTSGAAAMEGVKAYVVRAGKMKGAGTPGTEVTPEQLADWQRIVDALNNDFLAGVAQGRKMPLDKVAALADGRIHPAEQARQLGLIDYIDSFDGAMGRLRAEISPAGPVQPPTQPRKPAQVATASSPDQRQDAAATNDTNDTSVLADAAPCGPAEPGADLSQPQEATMPLPDTAPAAKANEPKPATIAELKAAFPKDPLFALESAEKAFTLTEAKAAYADVLATRLDQATAQAEQLKAAAAATAAKDEPPRKPGVRPLESGTPAGARESFAGDAKAEFRARVEELRAKGMSRQDAVRKVCVEQPDLQAAVIAQANPGKEVVV